MNEDLEQLLSKPASLKSVAARFDEYARRWPRRTALPSRRSLPIVAGRVASHGRKPALEARIERAKLPEKWTLESFPVQGANGRQGTTNPYLRGTGVYPQSREHRVHRRNRRRQDRLDELFARKAVQNGYRALFIRRRICSMKCTHPSPIAPRADSCSSLANVDILGNR